MRGWVGVLVLCLAVLAPATARADVVLPKLNVAALAAAGGRLFVGGFDEGVFVVEPGRAPVRLELPSLIAHVNALAWSPAEQVLWVGTARGLFRCRLVSAPTCRRLGPSSAVHALLLRTDGEVVTGGDHGLAFIRGEKTRVFGKKQRAPFRSVWALAESPERLYVGTTNGLFWGERAAFDSGTKLERASVVQGTLPDDWVTALLYRERELYVGTYRAGVARFSEQKRAPEPAGVALVYGHVNPSGLFALEDGALTVASMEGLWHGPFENPARIPTRTADVTGAATLEGKRWIATRRGLEAWEVSLTRN
jgi:ligand-binding sensor domain-containing protein